MADRKEYTPDNKTKKTSPQKYVTCGVTCGYLINQPGGKGGGGGVVGEFS